MAKAMKAANDNGGAGGGDAALSAALIDHAVLAETLRDFAKHRGDVSRTARALDTTAETVRNRLKIAHANGVDKWGLVDRYGVDDEVSEAVDLVERYGIKTTEEMAYAGGAACPNIPDDGGLEHGYGYSRDEKDQALAAIRVYSAMVFASRGQRLPQEIEDIGPW